MTKSKKRRSRPTYRDLASLLAAHDCDTAFAFGRSLYKHTACGPWTAFIVPSEPKGRVHYEDARARDRDWWSGCTALCIGSIVEGSDVEVGPVSITFPFDEQALETAVTGIDEEAAFYWKRDNSTYFTVLDEEDNIVLTAQWVQFEDEPEGAYPKRLASLAKKAGEILRKSNAVRGVKIPIPRTQYFVREDEVPTVSY